MNNDTIISSLEEEWDFENGFFGLVRRGEFDPKCLEHLISALNGIESYHDDLINRRIVSLLWYMPLFMEWQKERVQRAGGNLAEFDKATNCVRTQIERILGVP